MTDYFWLTCDFSLSHERSSGGRSDVRAAGVSAISLRREPPSHDSFDRAPLRALPRPHHRCLAAVRAAGAGHGAAEAFHFPLRAEYQNNIL